MKITIEFEPEQTETREERSDMLKRMLDAQNMLDHERRVVAEEREWLERAWSSDINDPPTAPQFVSDWARTQFDLIVGLGVVRSKSPTEDQSH
jgi:hypothetical protein